MVRWDARYQWAKLISVARNNNKLIARSGRIKTFACPPQRSIASLDSKLDDAINASIGHHHE